MEPWRGLQLVVAGALGDPEIVVSDFWKDDCSFIIVAQDTRQGSYYSTPATVVKPAAIADLLLKKNKQGPESTEFEAEPSRKRIKPGSEFAEIEQ